ncbi:hypothetical protein F4604DRAFT_1878701 [Suillus subluteus]|nr:hypothetical protein F4604DRAFT_1878701 [Suillus subluteus]
MHEKVHTREYCALCKKVSRLCDTNGAFIEQDSPPSPRTNAPSTNWMPYQSRVEFEMAEFLFTQNQMSAKQIDTLLNLWAMTLIKHNDAPPFTNHQDMYAAIDATPLGDVPWKSFTMSYDDIKPQDNIPLWMTTQYNMWFRDPLELVCNMLANPGFDGEIEFSPYCDYTTYNKQYWKNLMSGDWAWQQADLIAQNPETHGLTFVLLIMGSNKTIVSVATGHTEYHPLYLSINNIFNRTKEHNDCIHYRNFRQQLFQQSLAKIFESVKMCLADHKDLDGGQPCLHRCEEHTELLVDQLTSKQLWFEYGIIGDLVPFTNDFPYYLMVTHGAHHAAKIMDDVDRRYIAAAAPFAGFKQWTGDNSKALMKVYIPAIKDHVPGDIMCVFSTCLNFCYLVRLQEALDHFHKYWEIFKTSGSKHIKAVKEPWRCSSRFKVLGQMLLMNQCLDKVAAACADFEAHSMLRGLPGHLQVCKPQNQSVEGDAGEVLDGPTVESHVELGVTPHESVCMLFDPSSQYLGCVLNVNTLGLQLNLPHFPSMIQEFLHDQLHSMDPKPPHFDPTTAAIFLGKVTLFNSAVATLYVPSDLSGTRGMRHEHIQSTPSWWGGPARYDCIFINMDADADSLMGGLAYRTSYFPCAIVHWYSHILKRRDPDMGMYIVTPATMDDGTPDISIIHIDCVFCAAHLLPVYGANFITCMTSQHDLYDTFDSFYVNKYVDHHAFELASFPSWMTAPMCIIFFHFSCSLGFLVPTKNEVPPNRSYSTSSAIP